MRIAVLSDIHANLAALEAVRADSPDDLDEVWVLGDIVGYGPEPNEVIEALQEIGARSVLGNHDGAAIGGVDVSYFNPDARAAIEWTATAIDENARSYLATLPEVRRDGALTAVHGSPRDPIWEYITEPRDRGRELRALRHAALPVRPYPSADRVRAAGDGIEATPGLPGDDRAPRGRTRAPQPGQCRPAEGRPARNAAYAILETGDGAESTIAFRRVPLRHRAHPAPDARARPPRAPGRAAELRALTLTTGRGRGRAHPRAVG